MRDVDPGLLAVLQTEPKSSAFFTLRLMFPEPIGEVFLSDRDVTVEGQAHDGLVVRGGFGILDRISSQHEKRLDIGTVTIQVNNFPAPQGATGGLAPGERLSDLLIDEMEDVQGDLYLVGKDRLGGLHREHRFSGVFRSRVPGTGLSGNEERLTLTLLSLFEVYGSRSALRTITEEFRYARQDALGATIPVVLGVVHRAPGRVVKQGLTTRPLPEFENVGSPGLDIPPPPEPIEIEFDDDGPAQPDTNGARPIGDGGNPSPGGDGGCAGSPCPHGPEGPGDGAPIGDSDVPDFGEGSGGGTSCYAIDGGTVVEDEDGTWNVEFTEDGQSVTLQCDCAAVAESDGAAEASVTVSIVGNTTQGFIGAVLTLNIWSDENCTTLVASDTAAANASGGSCGANLGSSTASLSLGILAGQRATFKVTIQIDPPFDPLCNAGMVTIGNPTLSVPG